MCDDDVASKEVYTSYREIYYLIFIDDMSIKSHVLS